MVRKKPYLCVQIVNLSADIASCTVDIDDIPDVTTGVSGRRSSHSTAKKVSHVQHNISEH